MPTSSFSAGSMPAAPPRPRRRWRWLVLVLLVLLAALPFAWFFYQRWQAERLLGETIAALDRDDPDWRLADILAKRPTIAGENAADVVLSVHAKIPAGFTASAVFNDLDSPPPRLLEVRFHEAIKFEMRTLGKAVKEAHKLADLGEGRQRVNYAPDYLSSTYADIQKFRAVANLLQFDAMLRDQEGDQAGAWRSSESILGTARAIGDEPGAISQLVRIAVDAIALGAFERSLAHGVLPDATLARTQALIEKEAKRPILFMMARGERAGIHQLFSNLENGNIDFDKFLPSVAAGPGEDIPWWERMNSGEYLRRSHYQYLQIATEIVDTARQSHHEWRRRLRAVEEKLAGLTSLVKVLTRAVEKLGEAWLRMQSQLQCAAGALAAERFRLKEKRWPASLEELVKAGFLQEVPRDPYDGNPLRARRSNDGFVVYSVGTDGKNLGDALDDLDAPEPPPVRYEFRLWDPEHRRQPARPRQPVVDD